MTTDFTRRSFLHTLAGAAVGSTLLSNPRSLYGATSAGWSDGAFQPEPNSIESMIFPKPQNISASQGDFALDNDVRVLVPSNASEQDMLLARSLVNQISDQFGIFLKIKRVSSARDAGHAILMGSLDNPLVRQYCSENNLADSVQSLAAEGYVLHCGRNMVLIAGKDDRGAFYGLQSLRQLIAGEDGGARFRGVRVRDWPDKPFRGIYLFMPGRENIPYFKRFVSDFMALYKFNTLIMEMNASVRLESHPELNYGTVQFERDTNYSDRNYPPGPFHNMEQNSSHQDVADSGILEKEEVADMANWVRRHHIEFIPEIASFTHSYYLLSAHRDLAAVPQDKWPDIYCPANPKSYSLIFDIYDEYIELLHPKKIHIGHDELFLPVGVSPQCEDMQIGELYGQDVKKIHDHLAGKGIETQLWGDMLLQSVRGRGLQKRKAPDGWEYYYPGGLTPEQVERLIPKDCLIYNWFWKDEDTKHGAAEQNEATLDQMGFRQIFGNLEPDVDDYETRKKRATLLGGAPSAWAATNEVGFGKDMMSIFVGCSNLLWTGNVLRGKPLSMQTQSMVPDMRVRLSGVVPPSRTEHTIVPVDISGRFNTAGSGQALGVDLESMPDGTVQHQKIPFELKRTSAGRAIVVGTEGMQGTSLPKVVSSIPVGEAPTSLIFLHAAAKPAGNVESFRMIWDQQDTADLLGWYEIAYEDGLVLTVPIRYAVNILEWDWDRRASGHGYCYGADAVAVGGAAGNAMTYFAFEWINPRLGKVIREISLKGSSHFQGASTEFDNGIGPVIPSNAVILAALSMVRKRT